MSKPKTPTPMRTSREVYDRVRWDSRLDPTRFVIGYEARMSAPKEVAFTAFVPGGDIPWHRVVYFREGDAIVWDRRSRLDAVFERSQAPSDADARVRASLLDGAFFRPMRCFRHDRRSGEWTDAPGVVADGPAPGASLRIATYNVLSDAFEAARTHTERRIPAIVGELRALDADVIALQEVTPALVRALLASPWVRERYSVSEGPLARTVDPQGVLLLTRLPVTRLVEHVFSRAKRAILAELGVGLAPLAPLVLLRVVTIHLTSDRAPNAASVRRAHLGELLSALGPGGAGDAPVVIAGDFNWDDGELDSLLTDHGFEDGWSALHPDSPGLTFDPERNPLAALMSRTRRRARLDRIFLRDGALSLRPEQAALFATEPLPRTEPALHPSDHFGLTLVARCAPAAQGPEEASPVIQPALDIGEELGSGPVVRTALVLLPPPELWPPIQALRLSHDRHSSRWMPHVTLLYGFVPEDDFELARWIVARVASGIAPFEITLDRLDTFTHRSSRTVWARPVASQDGRLHALQRSLERAFPRCDEQGKKSPSGFTPHLTLAQLEDDDPEAEARLAAWRAAWKPLRFVADQVALISRRGDEPFEVRHRVPLGKRAPASPAIEEPRDNPLALWLGSLSGSSVRSEAQRSAIAHLRDACEAALPVGGRSALHLTGAARLGVQEPGGDVDAVALGPASVGRDDFFSAAAEWLRIAGGPVRLVGDAVAPVLRGTLSGVSVDLGYARFPEGLAPADPASLTFAALSLFDRESQGALSAVRDADAVLAALDARGATQAFRVALGALKRWAKARGLYSNAMGYMSGFGWTLLQAWACTRKSSALQEPGEALQAALQALALCDEAHPVALTAEATTYPPRARDVLIVPSPTAPVRNVARNVTRATAAVLRQEASAGAERVSRIRSGALPWDALLEPYDPSLDGEHFVALELGCARAEDMDPCAGWLEGRALGLLLELEAKVSPRLRPDPRRRSLAGGEGGARGTYLVALRSAEVDLDALRRAGRRLEESFEAWHERPSPSTLAVTHRSRAELAATGPGA